MLKHYRTLIRKQDSELPYELSLLDMPVERTTQDISRHEPWGATEGAVIDDDRGELVSFVVRAGADGGPRRRVLVPIEDVEVVYPEDSRSLHDAVLRVDWTPEQLRARPTFAADDRLPEERRTGRPPLTGRWLPARPIEVPRADWPAGRWLGAVWGLSAAVAGAVIGLLIGGPLIGATLALYCAVGAMIAGFMAGASRRPADASERDGSRPMLVLPEIERLEQALRLPDRRAWSFLEHTPILATAVPPQRAAEVRHAEAA